MNFLFTELEERTDLIEAVVSQEVRPRPYQIEFVDNAYRLWEEGSKSVLITSATGTGKSVMFSMAMARWDVRTRGRILLIAHRRELIYQAIGHAKKAGLKSGVEMGSRICDPHCDVVVSTVQTLNSFRKCDECRGEGCQSCGDSGKVRRFTKFDPFEFGLLVIDESHRSLAESFRNTFAWFEQNKNYRRLMVTATPQRGDGKGMHNVCDAVAGNLPLIDAINEGWLVLPKQKFVTVTGISLEQNEVNRKRDYTEQEIETVFLGGTTEEQEAKLHGVAQATIRESNGDQFLVFASSKLHARQVTAAFNCYEGIEVGCILDDTPDKERSEYFDKFRAGQLSGIVNCDVLTEGVDLPTARVLADCRPTKSMLKTLQKIGRITRPLPGIVDGHATAEERKAAIANSSKPFGIVIDFVGNSSNKAKSVVDVLAGDKVDPIDLTEALKVARKSDAPVDMQELVEKVKQAREEKEERRKEAKRKREITKHRATDIEYSTADVDLFRGDAWRTDTQPTEREMASSKQLGMLRRLGYRGATKGLSKKQASGIIGRMMAGNQIRDKYHEKIATAGSKGVLREIGEALGRESKAARVGDDVLQPLRELYKRQLERVDG